MARAVIKATGPEPPLEQDEIVVCQGKDRDGVRCGAEFTRADLDAEPLWDIDYDRVVCPACFSFERFVRIKVGGKVADRWPPGVSAMGWTGDPDVLVFNLKALGLTPSDYLVLRLHESYRRSAGGAVFPSAKTLAARTGMDERNMRKRFDGLVERGLLERERMQRPNGQFSTYRYTRQGLNQVLALMAANHGAGRPVAAGLPAMLRELKTRAGIAARRANVPAGEQDVHAHTGQAPAGISTRTSGQIHPRPAGESARAEAEAVEAEAVEAEPFLTSGHEIASRAGLDDENENNDGWVREDVPWD